MVESTVADPIGFFDYFYNLGGFKRFYDAFVANQETDVETGPLFLIEYDYEKDEKKIWGFNDQDDGSIDREIVAWVSFRNTLKNKLDKQIATSIQLIGNRLNSINSEKDVRYVLSLISSRLIEIAKCIPNLELKKFDYNIYAITTILKHIGTKYSKLVSTIDIERITLQYCSEPQFQKTTELQVENEKDHPAEVIPWATGKDSLEKLFIYLFQKKFISKMPSSKSLEIHFLENPNKKEIEKIDWIKDKYLLPILFDQLLERKIINFKFQNKRYLILSMHFTFKGKNTNPHELSSAKNYYMSLRDKKINPQKAEFAHDLIKVVKKLLPAKEEES